MERVGSKEEARQAIGNARRENKTVALVPTMGALHEGHLSLVRAACKRAQYVAVSIFVNPTQFGPAEDYDGYPRDLERDLGLLRAEGVDLVFAPSAETMYAHDAQVSVEPGPLAELWEGASRPGHFGGMATIVAKLLNVIRPDLAFFGEKDYQQLRIIERMVTDLDLAVRVVGCPTVRERDGLALSSRNAYLSGQERAQAIALSDALEAAAAALAWGETDSAVITAAMEAEVAKRPLAELEYAAIVDPMTLLPLATVDRPARALIALRVGTTRLIDNAAVVPCEGGAA